MYSIATMCHGSRFEPIFPHWSRRIKERCGDIPIHLLNNMKILENTEFKSDGNGIIWSIRFKNFLDLMKNAKEPIVMCDIDVIIEKNLQSLVDIPYDILISKEIGGEKAYPPHCSKILGFGICAGFGIYKTSSISFLNTIYDNMKTNKYGTYDDQINIMEHIVNSTKTIYNETLTLDGKDYTNIVIEIDGIKICVLDFDIVVRDPIKNNGQYANHINIDNVGGTHMLIEYFYKDFKDLPITCRCGKTWLGDFNVCTHLSQR
jgi:hypothetical protein